MVDIGTHSNLSTPPKIPAFDFKNMKKLTVTEKLTESVSAIASSFRSLGSVMSPQTTGLFTSVTSASDPQPINVGHSYLDTTPGQKSKIKEENVSNKLNSWKSYLILVQFQKRSIMKRKMLYCCKYTEAILRQQEI